MRSRISKVSILGCAALLMSTLVTTACGSDFSETEQPSLSIETPQGITLLLPDDEDRPRTQPAIEVRNTGGADLSVTRVELLNTPPRVAILGERGGECTSDADCDGDGVCFADNNTCAATGSPDTPFTIPPGQRSDIELVIRKGPREINCPGAAPEGTPDEFVDGYCGELHIETSATNDSGFIQQGEATLYFLAPSGSGQISVNPSFVEFLGVAPNYTDSRTFSVSNDGQQVLTINGISVEDRSNLFSISPTDFPIELEPGTSETFELTLDVGADEVNLNFDTNLNIDSTAANLAPFLVRVSEGMGAAPQFSADQTALVFDQQASQILTIENVGTATLVITSLGLQPQAASDFYSFEVDGAPFESFPISSGESKEVTVIFNRPAGNTDSSVAQLQIGHNDRAAGNRTTITLLGDEGAVPLAEILPPSVTFFAMAGEMDTRQFVIRNVGAAPLDITGVTFDFSVGSEAEFVVDGATGTVEPGDFATATISFTGANDTADNGDVVFASNNGGAELRLAVVSTTTTDTVVPVITPLFSGDIRPGGSASFSNQGTMPSGATSSWVLLERPAGSSAFGYLVGDQFTVAPDVAGSYTIGMTAREGTREAQTTTSFTVVE